ncbi:MAG: ADP-ribosylation factor-like protein [Candidatus Helarchaeota archaeon]
MLRNVVIFKDKNVIYMREFGKALPEETLYPLIESLKDYLRSFAVDVTDFMHVINFKICYATNREYGLLFVLVCDPTDKDDSVRDEIEFIRHKFLNKFSELLSQDITDPESYKEVETDILVSKSELRPKISLVGFSGVGKTTITKLIKEEEIPMRHIPTITGYISEIKVGDFEMYLWDLAGQVRYAEVWAQFMRGSDVIILITDSTEQNVYESRFFVELCRKEAPYARLAVIANKQDLPGALSPEQISDILDCGIYGYKVTPLVAIDTDNRIPALKILAETAASTAKTLADFQTLGDIEDMLTGVPIAIEKGYLKEAAKILDEIAYLANLRGDPNIAQKYSSYAAYIRSQNMTIEQKMKLVYKAINDKQREYL